MRLINADELINIIAKQIRCDRHEITCGLLQAFIEQVEAMPTVDAEPVRHGKWIEIVVAETDTSRLINWECSECAIVVDHNTDNYCPNCGARMVGE